MIQHLTRNNIAIDKYNACIASAQNSRIYAYSWYLDCVADNWDVLVLNDYEAVMPLPWRSKYFIKYIYPPCWTQQLGVFSSEIIKEDLVAFFLKSIPKQFKKQTLFLNSENYLKGLHKKPNYILSLTVPYEKLNSKFNKTRQRALNRSSAVLDLRVDLNFKAVIELFKKNTATKLTIKTADYCKLDKLASVLIKKKKLLLIKAFINEDLCAGAFFLVDNDRITYLFSSANKNAKKENAMSFIIDTVIKKYAETNWVLDFEGSAINSIAFFFKSFGAKKEVYYLFEKSFSLLK